MKNLHRHVGNSFTDPGEIRNDDADWLSVQHQPLSFGIFKDPADDRHLGNRKSAMLDAVGPVATKYGTVTQIAAQYASSVTILNC